MSRKDLTAALQQARINHEFSTRRAAAASEYLIDAGRRVGSLLAMLESAQADVKHFEAEHERETDAAFVAAYEQRELAELLVDVELGEASDAAIVRHIEGIHSAALQALAARDIIDAEVAQSGDPVEAHEPTNEPF